ncbi:MAG: putative Twin-arginine translocation protein TatA [Candidatus Eremiobacteraeota bacterium]|nr:putative Twin-arginine translocation protein TatA [Candidatus Eremiobacteraeota bacterium]
MLSIPDMALLGAAALLLFGPEQLPRVARKAGGFMREIQNTSQSFIREMERAADLQDEAAKPYEAPAYDPVPYDAAAYDGKPYDDPPYEAKPDYGAPYDATAAYDDAPTVAMPVTRAYEPPAPDPERPNNVAARPNNVAEPSDSVSERLAEPRPALNLIEPGIAADGEAAPPAAIASDTAEPAPQGDHSAHL